MSPTRLSRLESAMRVVLAFHEAFNRHDVAGMMQLMSDDCLFENTGPAPDGAVYSGKEAVRQFWQDFFRESPKAHIEIEEIFGLGKRCIMRWRYEWVDADGKKATSAASTSTGWRTGRFAKSFPTSRARRTGSGPTYPSFCSTVRSQAKPS